MNHSSENLSSNENQKVFKMLGNKKESVSTAVVQLLFAKKGTWQVQVTGVVCFVKDSNRRGYFFEVRTVHLMLKNKDFFVKWYS